MDRIITITTDFGLRDPYQGAIKGVVLKLNPRANIVDITHLITPGDIVEGAFILSGAAPFFPESTVHLAVVDPGVGTRRRPVLIETARFFFVGPDNGLLSMAAERDGIKRVIELTNKEYFLPEVSETFHGRDIFAPVAAHLALGADPGSFGPLVQEAHGLESAQPTSEGGLLRGTVIHVDYFGNLITNIRGEYLMEHITRTGPGRVEAAINGRRISGLSSTYGSVEKGALAVLIGSSGYMEIALNRGSASKELGAGRGSGVELKVVAR